MLYIKTYAKVNYPSTLRDEWASCFTATCLLLRRVRSLTVAPHVYSQVPYEVFMSYTDNANILHLSLISKPLKMVWFYAPFSNKFSSLIIKKFSILGFSDQFADPLTVMYWSLYFIENVFAWEFTSLSATFSLPFIAPTSPA